MERERKFRKVGKDLKESEEGGSEGTEEECGERQGRMEGERNYQRRKKGR